MPSLTVRTLCLGLAIVLFGVAAIGVGSGRFSLTAAGLFFLGLAELVG